MRIPLTIVAVSALLGCAANSDRTYRERDVEPGDPLVQWLTAITEHEPPDESLERAGLAQLEDIVEAAASVVATEDIDYPTPDLGAFDFIVEVDRRGSDEYEEWFYSALYPDDLGYGAKYLFDHAGLDHAFAATDAEGAGDLARIVDAYVVGDIAKSEALAELRLAERAVRERLGITEADWVANEQRFDASVDFLGAFTEPAIGCPLFRRCRIEVPHSMLGGSFLDLVHTYGHEILHCRIGDFESLSEDQRTIEETACEVFGARVVAQILASGRIPSAVLESLEPGFEPFVDDLESVGDETTLTDAQLIAADFDRLRELYHDPMIEFRAWQKTMNRYSYQDPLPGHDDDVAEQIDIVFDKMSFADLVALIPEMSKLDQLSKLAELASGSTRLSLADARAALGVAIERD
jgi:hypothetical protein